MATDEKAMTDFDWASVQDADLIRWLRYADDGKANFVTDRFLTELGREGYWELEQVGWERVPPYVQQGGFDVDREAIFRSRLTEKGKSRLALLLSSVS